MYVVRYVVIPHIYTQCTYIIHVCIHIVYVELQIQIEYMCIVQREHKHCTDVVLACRTQRAHEYSRYLLFEGKFDLVGGFYNYQKINKERIKPKTTCPLWPPFLASAVQFADFCFG